ncbi:hypothetical protein L228DRAFT_271065 [Xylona heveae TC161]|uniref:Uncharacterized protein n=1 Tax=Xylona heveae (strain CBS 132557 / TC161) TaxID=1328760 RepID=A0A164ZZK6_XYLHT|nr:hypothetical protein L228DRAFT_271065 [Xylona heveae TC161]KZF19745.1 hypothetical protein L228DRAFT_271065 [Xylona heveae TC161]
MTGPGAPNDITAVATVSNIPTGTPHAISSGHNKLTEWDGTAPAPAFSSSSDENSLIRTLPESTSTRSRPNFHVQTPLPASELIDCFDIAEKKLTTSKLEAHRVSCYWIPSISGFIPGPGGQATPIHSRQNSCQGFGRPVLYKSNSSTTSTRTQPSSSVSRLPLLRTISSSFAELSFPATRPSAMATQEGVNAQRATALLRQAILQR